MEGKDITKTKRKKKVGCNKGITEAAYGVIVRRKALKQWTNNNSRDNSRNRMKDGGKKSVSGVKMENMKGSCFFLPKIQNAL